MVDSDTLSRNAVQDVVCKMHLRCMTYESGQRFLAEFDRGVPGCLVCEVQIPDIGGLDIQRRLAMEDTPLPIVFLSSHATVPIVVRAMCEGAVHFLEKPPRANELWETIQKALLVDRRRRTLLADRQQVRQRLGSLTRGESNVWALWVRDTDARTIAHRLGITVCAVEHRQNTVLRKLGLRASLRLLRSIGDLFDNGLRWVEESAISRDIAAFHREHGLYEPHRSRSQVPHAPPRLERRSHMKSSGMPALTDQDNPEDVLPRSMESGDASCRLTVIAADDSPARVGSGRVAVARIVAGIAVLVATAVWAYWPTLAELVETWDSQPDYSHGYLVIPVALCFLWVRRRWFPGFSTGLAWSGLALIGLAFAMRWVAARYWLEQVDGWSILVWIAGVVWLFGGFRLLWWSLPSIAFLWFMIPWPYSVERWASLPLQRIATNLSCWVLQFLGQPALAEGNTILLGEHHLEIEQACSGLRIFVGIIALAFAYVILARRSWWENVLDLSERHTGRPDGERCSHRRDRVALPIRLERGREEVFARHFRLGNDSAGGRSFRLGSVVPRQVVAGSGIRGPANRRATRGDIGCPTRDRRGDSLSRDRACRATSPRATIGQFTGRPPHDFSPDHFERKVSHVSTQ